MADNELEGLLAEQIAYYRTRADEYDATYPLDAHADADARSALNHIGGARTLWQGAGVGVRYRAMDRRARSPRYGGDRR